MNSYRGFPLFKCKCRVKYKNIFSQVSKFAFEFRLIAQAMMHSIIKDRKDEIFSGLDKKRIEGGPASFADVIFTQHIHILGTTSSLPQCKAFAVLI